MKTTKYQLLVFTFVLFLPIKVFSQQEILRTYLVYVNEDFSDCLHYSTYCDCRNKFRKEPYLIILDSSYNEKSTNCTLYFGADLEPYEYYSIQQKDDKINLYTLKEDSMEYFCLLQLRKSNLTAMNKSFFSTFRRLTIVKSVEQPSEYDNKINRLIAKSFEYSLRINGYGTFKQLFHTDSLNYKCDPMHDINYLSFQSGEVKHEYILEQHGDMLCLYSYKIIFPEPDYPTYDITNKKLELSFILKK